MTAAETATARLAAQPRVRLAHLPTPLEAAPRLGAAIGLPSLRVKRDDCTGLALGGNKARKLEFLVADALGRGADTLITAGGAQSNHARMTAAAACRLGLRCVICFSDAEPPAAQGNLLLDQLLGAEGRFFPGADAAGIEAALAATAAELSAAGRQPYIIPVGGSTAVGALGYVEAARELAEQGAAAGWSPAAIVAATGSCGTLGGLLLGAALYVPECRVVGISVSRPAAVGAAQAAAIATETAALLGVERSFAAAEVTVREEWIGPGYGAATAEANAALGLAARTEGLLLDPVYTAKGAAGLVGMAARGEFGAAERVLFWHTGGAPALFARPETVTASQTDLSERGK